MSFCVSGAGTAGAAGGAAGVSVTSGDSVVITCVVASVATGVSSLSFSASGQRR